MCVASGDNDLNDRSDVAFAFYRTARSGSVPRHWHKRYFQEDALFFDKNRPCDIAFLDWKKTVAYTHCLRSFVSIRKHVRNQWAPITVVSVTFNRLMVIVCERTVFVHMYEILKPWKITGATVTKFGRVLDLGPCNFHTVTDVTIYFRSPAN